MSTLADYSRKHVQLTLRHTAAVDAGLGPCYEAALVKHKIPRPVSKGVSLVTGLGGPDAIEQLKRDPANAQFKSDIDACDARFRPTRQALDAQYERGVQAAQKQAYDSKVLSSAMILTDDYWLPRARAVRAATRDGWYEKGRWQYGDRDALIFEVNSVSELGAFVGKERLANVLLILLQRQGMKIRVAGDWKTLGEFALMVKSRGSKVRVPNLIYLGADDPTRDRLLEEGVLEAFHSEVLNIYLFDEPGWERRRTAKLDKIIEDARAELAIIKKNAAQRSIRCNDVAAATAAATGAFGSFGQAEISGALGLASGAWWWLGDREAQLSLDPSRRDFTARAAFEPVSLPAPATTNQLALLVTDLATAVLNEARAVDALRISVERLDGANSAAKASASDDMTYVDRQARASRDAANAVQEQLARQIKLLPKIEKEWAAAVAGSSAFVVPADFHTKVGAMVDDARDTIAKAGVRIPRTTIDTFKRTLRQTSAATPGTSFRLPHHPPFPTGLKTTTQRMRALETAFARIVASIEAG